ncbi:hypothetical protein IHE44_0007537 [Lamprotornis superbus]|uniref:Uncharacterized protein n=1 Tax=Lamprotornis superbus TaxID=245042 RepID=A0A835NYG8_9PASS|nr:hypothetical protein IHE44_0007537 [Lamprotornis superbus]
MGGLLAQYYTLTCRESWLQWGSEETRHRSWGRNATSTTALLSLLLLPLLLPPGFVSVGLLFLTATSNLLDVIMPLTAMEEPSMDPTISAADSTAQQDSLFSMTDVFLISLITGLFTYWFFFRKKKEEEVGK